MNFKAKPFVKWVGGKTQLIGCIEKILPENFSTLNDICYIEPFVGGGAILFWILQKFPNIKNAIISDINQDLITTYKTIKTNPLELVEMLQKIQDEYLILNEEDRKQYYLNKRNIFNTKIIEPIENSAIFIFLNRTCFNGLYRVNSKGGFNVPFGKYKNPKICDKNTIIANSKILQNVQILAEDFENTLNYSINNNFFYFDPPYKPIVEKSSFNSYTKEKFNDNEQIRLANFCKKINELGHKFILSNSDVKSINPGNNFFEDLYNSFNMKRVYATRRINSNSEKRGIIPELLIYNF